MAEAFQRRTEPHRGVVVVFDGFPFEPRKGVPADTCSWTITLQPKTGASLSFTVLGQVIGVDSENEAIRIDVKLPAGIMPAIRKFLEVDTHDASGYLDAWLNDGTDRNFDVWYYDQARELGLLFTPEIEDFLGSYTSRPGKPGAFQVFAPRKRKRRS